MEKRFVPTKEVAAFLCVSVRTLYNYASKHEFFRSSRPGAWHVLHVRILEKVWGGALTEDEGLTLWKYELLKMRRGFEAMKMDDPGDVKTCSKSRQRGQQRTSRRAGA